tara:strand:- start:313 stop:522 length:210 start_codon:yes stop_codon:yes gene_type:complete
MSDTRTPLQNKLESELYTLTTWDDIHSFVHENFPAESRRMTLNALQATPMDADHIEWRGIVDYAIRKFL